MPAPNHPSSKLMTVDLGGEHVACWPADPAQVVEWMSGILEVKMLSDTAKATSAMHKLAADLRRLSPASRAPEGGLSFSNTCCDIRDSWNEIRSSKVHVLSGRSAKRGTLILLFVPTHIVDYVVEVNCEF